MVAVVITSKGHFLLYHKLRSGLRQTNCTMLRLSSVRRSPLSSRGTSLHQCLIRQTIRHSSQQSASSQASRVDRITSKLPHRLQKYTARLRDAPVSHIVSFLILHEITAIVPLFALFGLFHYTDLVPTAYVSNHFGSYVDSGIAHFERYFTKKQWFGFGQGDAGEAETIGRKASEEEKTAHGEDVMRRAEVDGKYKLLTEVALAYAITKAALPIRIIGSIWATPWFAGLLIRTRGLFRRKT
ncbi:hypothetical protein CC79DRAFT_776191 [Sarocladium strictum]